jgi:multidrug efflux system outer membrane protein
VLRAFKDVEDSLAQIVLRGQQASALARAVASAVRVTELAEARYEAGTVSYLEVVDAKRNALRQERQQTQLEGQRFAASVRLIKALGGGWSERPIPKIHLRLMKAVELPPAVSPMHLRCLEGYP